LKSAAENITPAEEIYESPRVYGLDKMFDYCHPRYSIQVDMPRDIEMEPYEPFETGNADTE
jgi:hypothetical protein